MADRIARSTATRDRDRAYIRRGKPPCGICGDEIDYSLPSPDPMSYETDHIIALDNGGTDTRDNKQAAHRKCNRDKWNRTAEALAPRSYVTWRRW